MSSSPRRLSPRPTSKVSDIEKTPPREVCVRLPPARPHKRGSGRRVSAEGGRQVQAAEAAPLVQEHTGVYRKLQRSAQLLRRKENYWLEKLWLIKEMRKLLKIHEEKIRRHSCFERESSDRRELEFKVSGSGILLNDCGCCRRVCHALCRRAGDRSCAAMTHGLCLECRCSWDQHQGQDYKWEQVEVKEQETVRWRKKMHLRYREAETRGQKLMEELTLKYQRAEAEVEQQRREHVGRLEQLREMRPTPLGSPDLLDLLEEEEQHLQALAETQEKVVQSPAADEKTETFLSQMLSMN